MVLQVLVECVLGLVVGSETVEGGRDIGLVPCFPQGAQAPGLGGAGGQEILAFAEIGGAWLVWQGVREHRGWAWIGAGVIALGIYGFIATLQPDANFGRILAAYGGVFVAGSLAWGRSPTATDPTATT